MRYSVYVSGKSPLAYYSPEMTGFYNQIYIIPFFFFTIALPEMTGLYNAGFLLLPVPLTIALPEMTGFYNTTVNESCFFNVFTIALPGMAGL